MEAEATGLLFLGEKISSKMDEGCHTSWWTQPRKSLAERAS